MNETELTDKFKRLMDSTIAELSKHFGQPYFNIATVAGHIRLTLKKFAEQNGVKFPFELANDDEDIEKPWWINI